MSSTMSPDEQRRALQALGVPRAKIDAHVGGGPVDAHYLQVIGPTLTFPVRVVLPWSALCSDNAKYGATLHGTKPVMLLRPKYRAAKRKAHAIALETMRVNGTQFPPLARPLSVRALVWAPDNRPGHDLCNFSKCAWDAFEGAIWTNDHWLHAVHWIRAGVDVDRPRAEIEVQPL